MINTRNNPTTSNLLGFGPCGRFKLIQLLTAWDEYGLPDGFAYGHITFMFNRESGDVFLTNSDFQVAVLNGDTLELWHNCWNCGHEGFEETCQLNDDGCNLCNPNS